MKTRCAHLCFMGLFALLFSCVESAPRPLFTGGMFDGGTLDEGMTDAMNTDAEETSHRCPDSAYSDLSGCRQFVDEDQSRCPGSGVMDQGYLLCERDAERGCVDWQPQNCPDTAACVQSVCVETPAGAECQNMVAPDGSACEDLDPCIDGDTCRDGQCVAGRTPHCVDDDMCTIDTCNEETGECSFPDRDCRRPVEELPEGQYSGCNDRTGECELYRTEPCEEDGCDHPLDVTCALHGGTPFPRYCTFLDGPRVSCNGWRTSPDPCESLGETCRQAICTENVGCGIELAPVMAGCDDEDPCTTQTECNEDGECVGRPMCDDDDPCTADNCILGQNEGGQPVTCEHPPLENPPMECAMN